MQIVSENINIPTTENISTEYIENFLKEKGINPLRWAIVKTEENMYTVNCAHIK